METLSDLISFKLGLMEKIYAIFQSYIMQNMSVNEIYPEVLPSAESVAALQVPGDRTKLLITI